MGGTHINSNVNYEDDVTSSGTVIAILIAICKYEHIVEICC